ncbi:MAG: nucleotidyltransferase family protein [Myxococcota bacterium]
MRAMIVAAGLGTRLRPLTNLVPKPAVPVCGLPMIAYTLALLRHHGVTEVIVNTHHLPAMLERTATEHCPVGLALRFSREETLLDTGGGIRRAAGFLRESDPCLIVGGDMLLDADLTGLVSRHRDRGDAVSMLLREDVRADTFGTVGVDDEGVVRRIGSRHDLGGATRAGVYTWANVVSARAFDALPDREAFSHFDDWIVPLLEAGARDVRGDFAPCTWEPVGTPREYLAVNFAPPALSYLDVAAEARRRGVRLEPGLVVGAGAKIGAGASLANTVVWSDEHVPAGARLEDGVFAGGRFHAFGADAP